MQTDSGPQVLTTRQLSERWKPLPIGSSERSLCRYRRDPGHPLHFDIDAVPTHPTRGKGYSLKLIQRIEREWRV